MIIAYSSYQLQHDSQYFKDLFYNQVVERLEGELLQLQQENEELRSILQSQEGNTVIIAGLMPFR